MNNEELRKLIREETQRLCSHDQGKLAYNGVICVNCSKFISWEDKEPTPLPIDFVPEGYK